MPIPGRPTLGSRAGVWVCRRYRAAVSGNGGEPLPAEECGSRVAGNGDLVSVIALLRLLVGAGGASPGGGLCLSGM